MEVNLDVDNLNPFSKKVFKKIKMGKTIFSGIPLLIKEQIILCSIKSVHNPHARETSIAEPTPVRHHALSTFFLFLCFLNQFIHLYIHLLLAVSR